MKAVKQIANKLINAFGISCAGLRALWKGEQAFRLECYGTLIILPILFFLPIFGFLKLLLVLLALLLMFAEAVNSGLEAVVDRISLERHPQSKIAKDVGSAAVFIVIVMNAVAWCYVVWTAFGYGVDC